MNTTPIYYESAEHARYAGELELLRASRQAEKECRKAIDEAISKHFDGMHLAPDALADVLREHTPERVALILAVTLKDREYDGRFSRNNKAWSETIRKPSMPPAVAWGFTDMVLRSHSAIIDGYVDMFRKATA